MKKFKKEFLFIEDETNASKAWDFLFKKVIQLRSERPIKANLPKQKNIAKTIDESFKL